MIKLVNDDYTCDPLLSSIDVFFPSFSFRLGLIHKVCPFSRIQHQYNQLDQEYQIAAMGVLRHNGHLRRVGSHNRQIGIVEVQMSYEFIVHKP